MQGAPTYWMRSADSTLRGAVAAYLIGRPMTELQFGTLRAYLAQWIAAPGFIGPAVEDLRARVKTLANLEQLNDWVLDAVDAGIDPL